MAEWDRQDDESTLWFDRFERFRKMGPSRSLLAFVNAEAEQKGTKRNNNAVPAAWHGAAKKWRWKERAAAWDAEQVRIAREAEQHAIDERRKAQLAQTMAMQSVGSQGLLRLQETLNDPSADNPLSPRDVIALIIEGMKGERLIRGEPTEISQQKHSVDWDSIVKRKPKGDPIAERLAREEAEEGGQPA